MRERPSDPRVFLAISIQDRAWQAADGARELGRFGQLAVRGVAVDVLPGLRGGEGEVVRADTDGGAVSGVETLGAEGLMAGGVEKGPW